MSVQPDRPKFQIALTLAGAVAAGSYTAGVLDFLIEALDAWHADENAPHEVVLQAASGASAGSVCAAILAGMLRYRFPHVRLPDSRLPDKKIGENNPLYDAWVNRFGIHDLLACDDLDRDEEVMSLLDATRLDGVFRAALTQGGERVLRRYIADPFRLRFTLTNLRGVPYFASMRGATGEGLAMMMHEDHKRFAVTGAGGSPGRAACPEGTWQHEVVLPHPEPGDDDKYAAWRALADAALASSAIPLGLRPRTLHKQGADYSELPLVYPGGHNAPARIYKTVPEWGDSAPCDYAFVNVDGGLMNNEPVELARQALAGDDPLVRNDQSGKNADRAVLLIDPFVGREAQGPWREWDADLRSIPGHVLRAFVNNAHYHPLDLVLANRGDVYSRFLIAPDRGDQTQVSDGRAIAGGALHGFGGYLAWQFRAHDYFLGRRNCQRFLEQWFSLPEGNHLFDQWPEPLKEKYRRNGELPIIPLVGNVHPQSRAEPLPDWPAGKCNVEDLVPPLEQRLDRLYAKLTAETSLLYRPFLWLGWNLFARGKVVDWTRNWLNSGLRAHGLL